MLDRSLAEYGAGRSVLVDRSGNVIAGNKTIEAARRAGRTKVVVVPTDGETLVAVQRTDLDINSRKARRLAIADNRVAEVGLEWNPDELAAFDTTDLEGLFSEMELRGIVGDTAMDEGPEPQIDRADELQAEWNTATGQVWEIGKHRLLCGIRRRRPQRFSPAIRPPCASLIRRGTWRLAGTIIPVIVSARACRTIR